MALAMTNAGNDCKGHFNRLLKPLFGKSIFLYGRPSWRKRQQEAAPVFANGNFEVMFPRWAGSRIRE
jgi:hypothetical protein